MTDKNKCPICGRPAQPRFKPFCSTRCADLDLGRWLKGSYAIPAHEESEEDETDKAAGKDEGEA